MLIKNLDLKSLEEMKTRLTKQAQDPTKSELIDAATYDLLIMCEDLIKQAKSKKSKK